jgi:hypothetical protein
MANYSGLLVRDTFKETGTNPTPQNGAYWYSPDIIPYGNASLSWTDAINDYNGPDIGESILGNQINYIYIRSINTGSTSQNANVNLYWVPSNLLMLPNQWTEVVAPNTTISLVDQNNNTQIQAGAYAMLTTPFIIQNLTSPTTGNHLCLIAVVNNGGIPFTIPASFSSNAAFGYWITQYPNIAQRNINFYQGSNSTALINMFGNTNANAATMIFTLQTTTNMAGAICVATCNDSRLSSPFSFTGTFNASGNDEYTVSFSIYVPGSIGTSGSNAMAMAFTITMPAGQTFPDQTIININYYQVPDNENDPYEKLMIQEQEVHLANESGEITKQVLSLIKLGGTSSIINANSSQL